MAHASSHLHSLRPWLHRNRDTSTPFLGLSNRENTLVLLLEALRSRLFPTSWLDPPSLLYGSSPQAPIPDKELPNSITTYPTLPSWLCTSHIMASSQPPTIQQRSDQLCLRFTLSKGDFSPTYPFLRHWYQSRWEKITGRFWSFRWSHDGHPPALLQLPCLPGSTQHLFLPPPLVNHTRLLPPKLVFHDRDYIFFFT